MRLTAILANREMEIKNQSEKLKSKLATFKKEMKMKEK